MYDGIKTTELDNLAAETCAYMNIIHPHFSLLAARISVDNLHKETSPSFVETAKKLYNYVDKAGIQNHKIKGRPSKLLADDVY